ncbi:MAG: helix-turn-helix domain-containing protein [Candidatus Merdivicinus sp.]|jgi:two-component system response regulator YesN
MQADLVDVLKTYLAVFNISVLRVTPPFHGLENFDYGLRRKIDPMFDWEYFGTQILQNQRPSSLIMTEDTFGARYGTFSPPDEYNAVILIGPWRGAQSAKDALSWAQRNLDSEAAAAVQSYYDTIPQISEQTVIASMVAIVEMMFPSEEFCVEKLWEYRPFHFTPDSRFFSEPILLEDLPASSLEQRYAAENAFLDAVAAGNSNAALKAYQQFCRFYLGERFHATIRSRQNALIILNTLLRKAIERSGVHPYYLHIISSKYSYKIESLVTEKETIQLQTDMFQEYCAYVQRYSLRQYSPPVQKVINYINFNLDKPLSLKELAALCCISPSYLSNLFKQETGSTLTNYIYLQRIQRATYRLLTTDNTISSIAGEVGVLDVNYFTKIFKKIMGSTPTQYRQDHRS